MPFRRWSRLKRFADWRLNIRSDDGLDDGEEAGHG